MTQRSLLRRRLGVWRTTDLRAEGVSHDAINQRIATGVLTRLGRGWYGSVLTPPAVSSALSRNARLTCVSAARVHGLWVPPDLGTHCVSRRPAPGELEEFTTRHRPFLRQWPDDEPVMPLRLTLLHAAHCLAPEHTAVLLESARERRLLDADDIECLLTAVPQRTRRDIGEVQASAGSGSETRVRRYLERKGVKVRAQAVLHAVGRVDLLVGDRLIIECDSRAHHTSPEAYQTDRLRDAMSLREGFLVLRLTWESIWLRWEETQELLDSLIRRKVHRGSRL